MLEELNGREGLVVGSKIGDGVVYMVVIIFGLNSFYVVMRYGRERIERMVDLILGLLGILVVVIATGGGVVCV
ncbi:stage III sporulation protein AE [Bacillus thuringiensis]|uniref:stage III sporulation protein AE n=1 Tax=Bacillus thuringiensis TaxID=1428 RepID=UPI0011A92C5B